MACLGAMRSAKVRNTDARVGERVLRRKGDITLRVSACQIPVPIIGGDAQIATAKDCSLGLQLLLLRELPKETAA